MTDDWMVWKMRAKSALRERDRAISERDQARDMCCRLEHALYHLGAWDPTNKVGAEMIREDLDRGGAASIERAR